MTVEIMSKSVVSVTEMSRMVGLSRARFYQLVKSGCFPAAEVDPQTKRPFYNSEQQAQILDVRRRNCGVDGKPVLFYSRRTDAGAQKSRKKPAPQTECHVDLIEGLKALNVTVTGSQLTPILNDLFPAGTHGRDQGEVLRAVLQKIRRQNCSDSVG